MNSKIQNVAHGSALIYVLAVIAAASVLLVGAMRFVVSQVKYDTTIEPSVQAFHTAEAGIYFYRWYLAHNVEGRTASQIANFWANNPLGVDDNGDGDCDDPDTADGDGDGTEAYVANYEGIGQYKLCVTPPGSFSTIVSISSEGKATSSGFTQEKAVHARLRKPSWSEFAILANAATRLSEGTEVYGPMHVNGGFEFDGVAHNVVSSSVSSYKYPDSDVPRIDANTACWDNDPRSYRTEYWCKGVWTDWNSEYNNSLGGYVFQAGKEFPVVEEDFNSVTANFEVIRGAADSMGLYYGPEEKGFFVELGQPTANQMRITRVNKYNSDTFAITTLKAHSTEIKNIPDVGVMYMRNNIWIEGTLPVDKRLTIAANDPSHGNEARIFLGSNDIFYADRDSDSVLGLISEGNIEIIRDSDGSLTAPHGSDAETLNVDAVLLSQTGRVGRADWQDCKDTISLYGAIATNTRMGFGYVGGSCPEQINGRGFAHRNLIFDGKLLYYPPPLFPTGNSYVIDMWDASN